MTPPAPSSPALPSWAQRLVEQLQLLSEVTEMLTYRLLELEERLVEGERELAQLRELSHAAAGMPEAVESWLEDTDERLSRVEALLRRGEGRSAAMGAARPLKAVAPVPSRPDVAASLDEEADPDPFPEEEEQAFLEEQPFLGEQSA